MKNVLCYGDSNTWGCKPISQPGLIERYDPDVRWTSVMQRSLGDKYNIIAEGQNGRTTVHDDPIDGAHKNGKPYLLPCLETHLPLDLVIVMLGTNDLKSRFSVTAFDIASSITSLVNIVATIAPKNGGIAPQVLVVAPPPLSRLSLLANMFEGGAEKSKHLAKYCEAVSNLPNCHFLDAGKIITSSDIDGVHFDADQHALLGDAMAGAVRKCLENH